ncbi:MAG: hypothetical protein PHY23_07000 [Oscillospiraceae bacterium]|nr:hypothetical protein [Oscillospiraceae bacterium]
MGYQESLVCIRPQRMFDTMVRKCEQVYQTDYYNLFGANPVSVITLKQPLGGMPPGTKLLWVCGERCFHNEMGIFNGRLKTPGLYHLKIIPAEQLFECGGDKRLVGLKLNANSKTTENAYLRRDSFEHYAKRLQSREKER